MTFIETVDRMKTLKEFRFFYWFTKVLLGVGFIISGLRKMPGIKFTTLPIDNPIRLFFEGMYAAGSWWNFVGYYQIIVGILFLTPWLQRLTPVLALPITINIFLISVALHMSGTPFITMFMVFANLFLLSWHIRAYLPLLQFKNKN